MNVLLLPFDGSEHTPSQQPDHLAEPTETDKSLSPLQTLTRIKEHTSLYWTARSLADSRRVQHVTVLCKPQFQQDLRSELPNDRRFELANFESKGLWDEEAQSLIGAVRWLEGHGRDRIKSPTLVVSCAAPHWSGKLYDDVISYTRDSNLDSALFYVNNKAMRTRFKEIAVTPLPFFKKPIHILPLAIVGPEFVEAAAHQFERFQPEIERFDKIVNNYDTTKSDYRKSESSLGSAETLALLRLGLKASGTVGFGFVWHLAKRNLSPELVEKAVRRVLKIRFEWVELNEGSLPLTLSNTSHHTELDKLLTSPVAP